VLDATTRRKRKRVGRKSGNPSVAINSARVIIRTALKEIQKAMQAQEETHEDVCERTSPILGRGQGWKAGKRKANTLFFGSGDSLLVEKKTKRGSPGEKKNHISSILGKKTRRGLRITGGGIRIAFSGSHGLSCCHLKKLDGGLENRESEEKGQKESTLLECLFPIFTRLYFEGIRIKRRSATEESESHEGELTRPSRIIKTQRLEPSVMITVCDQRKKPPIGGASVS